MPWNPESWVNTSAIRSGQTYDLNESRLESEALNRKIAEENLLMKQAEAQRAADAYKLQQQSVANMAQSLGMGGAAPQAEPAELAEGIVEEIQQSGGAAGMPVGDAPVIGPQPPSAGAGAPMPSGGPGVPPPGGMAPAGLMPGEQGGIPMGANMPGAPGAGGGMPPMAQWAQANPVAAQGMLSAYAMGDGEGYRKYLTQYQDWIKADQFSEPFSLPGQKGLFKKNLRTNEISSIGSGTNIDIDLGGEGDFMEWEAKNAAERMDVYRQQGSSAAGEIKNLHRMYQVVTKSGETGALGDLRTGIAKFGEYVGMPTEWIDAVTGIDLNDERALARLEQLRSQGMDRMFTRIEKTKGAISNREMELFKLASAGIHNTRFGNILLLEAAMEIEGRKIQYATYMNGYLSKHGRTAENVIKAESEWLTKREESPELFADAWHQRSKRIMSTNEVSMNRLNDNIHKPEHQKLFYEAYGWLPRGIKVQKGWKYHKEGQ